MKIVVRNLRLVCLMVCATGMLAGCAWLPPKHEVADSIIDYNLAIEKNQNEMLLLNIVRASKRHPMYFTGFNLLRGSMSYNFQTGSLTLPFGKIGTGFNGAYSIAPSVGYSTNPSFDVGVLDTKEFTRGIMTPVTMETVDYYLQQGWPKEVILHLFIKRIKVKNGQGKLELFDNYPENSEEFSKFQKKLQEIKKCAIETRERPSIGPTISAKEAEKMNEQIEVLKAGLMLAPVRSKDGTIEGYQLKPQKNDYVFNCGTGGKLMIAQDIRSDNPAPVDATSAGKIYLRSPEAIVYYLGEILRVESHAKADKRFTPAIEIDGCESRPTPTVSLFVVQKEPNIDRPASVSVEYEGTKFTIPKNLPTDGDDGCRIDRSMHVLTLVSQLISQQKAAENIPVTGVVSILGR